jgi:hypothetical protein
MATVIGQSSLDKSSCQGAALGSGRYAIASQCTCDATRRLLRAAARGDAIRHGLRGTHRLFGRPMAFGLPIHYRRFELVDALKVCNHYEIRKEVA